MKKWLLMVLAAAVSLGSLAGCGTGNAGPTEPKDTAAPTENTAKSDDPVPTSESSEKPEDPTKPTEEHGDVLVVVFSATGTTRSLAEKIASVTGGDLKEIVPVEPYTSADLNYGDSNTRATREQREKTARPAIAEDISMEGYKRLYLGYPIWWGMAPRILCTFVEGHDFSGIDVYPFCTSGSSDIGESDDELERLAGSGSWFSGKRFSGSASEEEIREWIGSGEPEGEKTVLNMYINDMAVPVLWEKNESVEELETLARSGECVVKMSKYGGFEQVGALGTALPRNDVQTTTEAGDVVLYSGDQIVVFYGSNSWSYTKLGHIDLSKEKMTELLSGADVTVTIKVETQE